MGMIILNSKILLPHPVSRPGIACGNAVSCHQSRLAQVTIQQSWMLSRSGIADFMHLRSVVMYSRIYVGGCSGAHIHRTALDLIGIYN